MASRRDLDLIPLEEVEVDNTPPSTTLHPQRRWAPFAALAVFALVVATALALTDEDGPDAAPATTLPGVPPPPVEPPAGNAGLSAARGMLLDDPAWYFASAYNLPLDQGDDGALTRVWRADGGRAVMVESRRVDGAGPSGVTPVIDGVWTSVDGTSVVARRSGVDRLAARRQYGGWTVSIEAVGIDAATFARFVATGAVVDRRPAFDDSVLGDDYRLSSRPFPASSWLAGAVVARTEYRTVGLVEPLVLQVGLRPLQPGQGVLDLLADDIDDRNGIATGALLSQPGINVALWYLPDGRVATATGPVPAGELRRVAAQVRVASAAEWTTALGQQPLSARPRTSIVLGSGITGDAITWQAGVQRVEAVSAQGWRWWWTAPAGDGAEWAWLDLPVDAPLPRSLTVAYPGLTYVLVALPIGGGRWTVTVDTGSSQLAVVAMPLAGSPWTIAAVAVEESGPFRIVASRPGEADVLIE